MAEKININEHENTNWYLSEMTVPMIEINGKRHYVRKISTFPRIEIETMDGITLAISRFTIHSISQVENRVNAEIAENTRNEAPNVG